MMDDGHDESHHNHHDDTATHEHFRTWARRWE
jgi:hypothetical protein